MKLIFHFLILTMALVCHAEAIKLGKLSVDIISFKTKVQGIDYPTVFIWQRNSDYSMFRYDYVINCEKKLFAKIRTKKYVGKTQVYSINESSYEWLDISKKENFNLVHQFACQVKTKEAIDDSSE